MATCKNPCSFWGVILGLRQGGAPAKFDGKPGFCHSRAWFGLFCNKNKCLFTWSRLLLIKPMVFRVNCAQLGWAGQNGTGSFACKSNGFSTFFHRPAPRFPEQKLMEKSASWPRSPTGRSWPHATCHKTLVCLWQNGFMNIYASPGLQKGTSLYFFWVCAAICAAYIYIYIYGIS